MTAADVSCDTSAEVTPRSSDWLERIAAPALLALVLAALTLGNAWVQLHLTPMGIPPDESAHLTYVQEVASGQHLIPDYAHSRVLRSGGGNYLGHPPLYYSILGLTGRAFGWRDAMADYIGYRTVSAIMVALGVMAWVLAGVNLEIPRWQLASVMVACNAIPMFPYLAGSVNNDNLAYLAVAICFYGVSLHARRSTAAYYVAAAGLLACALTKANAAVFAAVFLVLWLAQLPRGNDWPLHSRHFWIALAIAIVGACAFFIPTFVQYGTFFPKTGQLYSHFPPPVQPLSRWAAIKEFVEQMVEGLPMVLSHASIAPIGGWLRSLFFCMLLMPLCAWLASRCFSPASKSVDRVANAMFVAMAVLIAVHCVAVLDGYYAHGRFAGLQPRYYNFVLTGLMLCCMLRPSKDLISRTAIALFSISAATTFALSIPSLVESQTMRNMAHSQRVVYSGQSNAGPIEHLGLTRSRASGGHIDTISLSGNAVTIAGWAIDAPSRRSASNLLIVYDGRIVGIAPTGLGRKDMAASLVSDGAKNAGFTVTVTSLPHAETCKVDILAEQLDGSFAPLESPGCR